MRLQDKVALVTGSAQGIGLAPAVRFASEGARVVVADLRPQAVEAAVAGLRAAGGRAMGCVVDVTQRE
ncbi:MAG: SDR family NAD(P)-dependent oxidoreductase, partial [Burkholderiales bacterium]